MRRLCLTLAAGALVAACGRTSSPPAQLPSVVYNYDLNATHVAATPKPLPSVPLPHFPWQPLDQDVQVLAERFAPVVVMAGVDQGNEPVRMLYAPFINGKLIALRYFVLYQDEDLEKKWEDKLYDRYRKAVFGSETDIEPIEVYLTADTKQLAGVSFKTGDQQAYFKRFVREKKWLTVAASELTSLDRSGDRPRIGVSTWNHLHDLPSVLVTRDVPPVNEAPDVPVERLTEDDKTDWQFADRGLLALPHGDRL